ncbi:transcription elongation factor GreB [Salinisphaera sp. USBA-960]|uniref:transcription elongation factor GreB n=1 Tax=Salinisphaera orenii TaxID=856731 RepID=UPI000DBE3F6E|nr:transcription elongation factor GreB [Salifodinibacter halophilus]NNC26730.1 transcription elongation factor GreB [Salifodinibacter halophilus]
MAQRDYITRAGWQTLAAELDNLWRERRPHVVRELAAAAAEGDRSENAEYIYRKKELREIDSRIRYLRRRLDALTVVEPQGTSSDRVYFGASVEILDDADTHQRYRIVGADETNAATGAISMHSPVARALLGCQVGDEVVVETPGQRRYLSIESISYDDTEAS